jgi:hypothetical protein
LAAAHSSASPICNVTHAPVPRAPFLVQPPHDFQVVALGGEGKHIACHRAPVFVGPRHNVNVPEQRRAGQRLWIHAIVFAPLEIPLQYVEMPRVKRTYPCAIIKPVALTHEPNEYIQVPMIRSGFARIYNRELGARPLQQSQVSPYHKSCSKASRKAAKPHRVVRTSYHFAVVLVQVCPNEFAHVTLGNPVRKPPRCHPRNAKRSFRAWRGPSIMFYNSLTLRFFIVMSYWPNAHNVVAVSRKATMLGSHANSVYITNASMHATTLRSNATAAAPGCAWGKSHPSQAL